MRLEHNLLACNWLPSSKAIYLSWKIRKFSEYIYNLAYYRHTHTHTHTKSHTFDSDKNYVIK